MSLSISEKILHSIINLTSIRYSCSQFIGLLVCSYAIVTLVKTISILISLPIRFIYNLLPQTIDYRILLFVFSLCLIVSLGKKYSLMMKILFVLSLQIIFLLLPIVALIVNDRWLLSNVKNLVFHN